MKLYEINREIDRIFEFENQEEPAEIALKLDSLEIQRIDKIANIALFYKNLSAFQSALSEEIKNLSERKKSVTNKIEFLKEYLRKNLFDDEKFNEPNFSLSWRKSSLIEIDPFIDESKFADTYPDLVNIKIEIQKNKVKDLIKKTGLIPEGIAFTEKQNLIIK